MFSVPFCLLIAPIIFGSFLSAADIDESSNVQNNNLKCSSDRDCPEAEHCFENKICSRCFSCEEAHRHKSRIRCPRKVKDCGPCLPGYVKESFSVPNKRTVCIGVVTVAQPQLAAEHPEEIIFNPILTIGITVIGVLVLIALSSWYCFNKKRAIGVVTDSWQEMGLHPRPQNGDSTSFPPPSYEDCQRSDNGSVAYSFQLRVTERPETKTTAIPFQIPFGDHILQFNNNSENSSAAENLSNVPVSEETETDYQNPNFNIHDESTQPSMWSPGTSYLVTQNSDETDGAAAAKKDENEGKTSPENKRRKTAEEPKQLNDA